VPNARYFVGEARRTRVARLLGRDSMVERRSSRERRPRPGHGGALAPGAVDRCADRAAAERRIDASDPLGAAADLEVAASLVEVAGDGGSVTSCGRIVFGACLVCLVLWAGTGLALTRESERR